MFFATTAQPQLRRQAYVNPGRSLERFMDDALRTTPAIYLSCRLKSRHSLPAKSAERAHSIPIHRIADRNSTKSAEYGQLYG